MRDVPVRVGEHEVFAYVGGSGPAFVFIHGGLGTHLQTLPHLEPLADEFTVISIDARGRGKSVCTDPAMQAWSRHADDLLAIFDHLGVEQAAIGGASFGAAMTAAFGLRHPSRCAALVFVAPATAGNQLGWVGQQQDLLPRLKLMADAIEAHGAEKMIEQLSAGLPEAAAELLRRQVEPHNPESLVATIRGLSQAGQPFDRAEDLERLEMPTLLIPGGDPAHPRVISDLYADHLPNVEVAELSLQGELGGPGREDAIRQVMVPVLRSFLRQHLSVQPA